MPGRRLPAVAATCMSAALAPASVGQCTYASVQLVDSSVPCPPPFPAQSLLPLGFNQLGQIVGYYPRCAGLDGEVAFSWAPASGLQTLSVPPGVDTARALAVNDAGTVVGYYRPSGQQDYLGCIWLGDQFFTVLPSGDNQPQSYALAINNAGQVVGARTIGGVFQPFLWDSGVVTDLPTGPFTTGRALAISDAGYIAGYLGNPTVDSRGCIWKDGVLTVLEPLPGSASSDALAANNDGMVAGRSYATVAGGLMVALPTVWMNGEPSLLPLLPGYSAAAPEWIADNGIIAGKAIAIPPGPIDQGVIWIDGAVYNLKTLVPEFGGVSFLPKGLNAAEQILGRLSSTKIGIFAAIGRSSADVSGDCHVDGRDIALILGHWGNRSVVGDVNGDGFVDGSDLAEAIAAWGG